MKSFTTGLVLLFVISTLLVGCSKSPDAPAVVQAAPPGVECSEAELSGYAPPVEEQRSHRLFAEPTITYPYGLDQEQTWGFRVAAKVDESGRVVCYRAIVLWLDDPAELNEQRRLLLAEVGQWRYQPFLKDGKPAVAIVGQNVYEQEAPEVHRPLPAVPLDQVQIGLERTACFGSCPSYELDIHGDGRVVYTGRAFIDVVGEHTYRIPPERVAKLVESLRAKDLWSLREVYRAQVTDNPSYALKLRFGDQVRELQDYAGALAAMPRVVTEFEDEIDEAAGVRHLIDLSAEGLKLLEASGFRYRQ